VDLTQNTQAMSGFKIKHRISFRV